MQTPDCPEILAQAAINSGWEWRFTPWLTDGVPARFRTDVSTEFRTLR